MGRRADKYDEPILHFPFTYLQKRIKAHSKSKGIDLLLISGKLLDFFFTHVKISLLIKCS